MVLNLNDLNDTKKCSDSDLEEFKLENYQFTQANVKFPK